MFSNSCAFCGVDLAPEHTFRVPAYGVARDPVPTCFGCSVEWDRLARLNAEHPEMFSDPRNRAIVSGWYPLAATWPEPDARPDRKEEAR
jgi:hypothetical protein